LVRLGPAIDTILTQHAYPTAVATMLGEAIALAVALAGALKYEGVFTLQTKGNGPIKLMVADITTAGAIRGYAQFDEERVAAVAAGTSAAVPRLLGAGYLALTVDQGEHTERYQGIVELQGSTLAECVHHYFRQSEQVEAALKVAVAQVPDANDQQQWRAGALMIQRLPREAYTLEREEEDDAWRRATIFMSSSTSSELVDPNLAPERLLFRLFHEDGVRAHASHPLAAQCRCSRQRVETVLRALSPEDLADMKIDGKITATCEFCSTTYEFDEEDLEHLVPQESSHA
jgi:molecular chaperone Hsp33